jgi:hypothetical protein
MFAAGGGLHLTCQVSALLLLLLLLLLRPPAVQWPVLLVHQPVCIPPAL